MIQNYDDFCHALLAAGFSIAGSNNEGVYSLINFGWNDPQPDTLVRWHTGDPDHDPWEWRIQVLDKRDDIAYSKLFFRKAGYITREWYPYFLAARRGSLSFADAYADGIISHSARRIFAVLQDGFPVPLHALKTLAGFSKEDKSQFDRALTELQMRLFITMCGQQQKVSQYGEEYGWSSTVFCTTEHFWDSKVFEKAAVITPKQAEEAITKQVFKLNPSADAKKIKKFVYGE